MNPVDRVDRAIAAIDVGLQTAGDASYGTAVPEGKCWRCLRSDVAPGSSSGLCSACRTVLLAEPADVADEPPPSAWVPFQVAIDGQMLAVRMVTVDFTPAPELLAYWAFVTALDAVPVSPAELAMRVTEGARRP